MSTKGAILDPRLLNMIIFFIAIDCGKHSKVALMKYLFYSDFTYYRDYGKTISDENYVHIRYGPCPDKWKSYLDYLVEEKLIKLEIRRFVTEGGIKQGSYYTLDKGVFSDTLFDKIKIERMNNVYSELSKYNAMQLSDLTHHEAAWLQSENGKIIDLKYAYFIDLLENEDEEEEEIPSEVYKAINNLEKAEIL